MVKRMVREMALPLSFEGGLQWWEWAKLLGLFALLVLPFCFRSPLALALSLHLFVDFSAQSAETARLKPDRGRHLALHASIAGGLPLAVAGTLVSPLATLTWMAAGIVSHYLIDYTDKFGIRHVKTGAALDQAAHLITILLIVTIR